MKEYIVHRSELGGRHQIRRVTHRASGRELGRVGEHYREEGQVPWWSAWLPEAVEAVLEHDEGAVNADPELGMHHAAEQLLHPSVAYPVVIPKECEAKLAARRFVMGGPSHPKDCPDCQSTEDAVREHRAASPEQWEHYDWLVELKAARSTSR